MRVFPISNWTELDVWQYIAQEKIALPSLFSIASLCSLPNILAALNPLPNSTPFIAGIENKICANKDSNESK
ncbi:MAG TPA: phosphoadenosine phosphosulfate reductase family protein [Chitinophagaceae bacterium]|nr:phosphoadenosine phosphosulfate reductase family protein [Chitinophagaceae bacterium]